MKLIVGLGNPGREHANNRHNLGFICLNNFARKHGIHFNKKLGLARTGSGKAAGSEVILARPQTFMNQSGQSVSRLAKKFKINPEDILVIYDDLDLPTGKIRLRQDGGSGGHKGVKSISNELGSQNYNRLKIGIGRPDFLASTEAEIIDYVLNNFNAEEKQIVDEILPEASEAVLCFITDGITAAMSNYN